VTENQQVRAVHVERT